MTTDNVLYSYWRKGSYLYAVFSDLQSGTSKVGAAKGSLPIHNDLNDDLPFIIPQYASDGCLYCILTPEMMKAGAAKDNANDGDLFLLKITLKSEL